MRHHLHAARLTLAAIILLAVAGCANKPPPLVPAMVPLSANGDYGYSETALAPDLYAVTFVSPSLSAHGDPAQGYGLDGEKNRVATLAHWRAAQLAQEKGYAAFRVEDRFACHRVFRKRELAEIVSVGIHKPQPSGARCGVRRWKHDLVARLIRVHRNQGIR